MYLVYQDGDENPQALCLTKTSAEDIVKYINPNGAEGALFTWIEQIEPVDLDQFVKSREPILPIVECPKCGAKGVAFICDEKGCPVNGGAAYS